MLSPEAEIESLRAAVARQFSVYGVVVSPMALTFQVGVPPGGVDAPFDALRLELVPKDYIPTITQEKGETLVHVQRRPRPRFARTQVNLILLLVTVLTTTFFGGAWNWAGYSGQPFLSAESIGFRGLVLTAAAPPLRLCRLGRHLRARDPPLPRRPAGWRACREGAPGEPPALLVVGRHPHPVRTQPVLPGLVSVRIPDLHPRRATSAAVE